ncbi:ABC transporter permease [Candidatus Aerophobetes bacterium]|nr:ABC transporter permease [Candidatus Aerophobetes bacterium]
MKQQKNTLYYWIVSYGITITIYSIISLPQISILFFPRPEILPPVTWVFKKVCNVLVSGLLFRSTIRSLERMTSGYIIGGVLGVSFGLLLGWSKKVDYMINPYVQLIRPIPALALIPLFTLWFGIGEVTKILLIVEGVFFVTLISTYEGVKKVPIVYIEAARCLGASNHLLLQKVVIPAAVPYILSGFRVALATAWAIIVAAEIVASKEGLGYLIIAGSNHVDASLIYVGIMGIGFLAYLFDKVTRLINARLTVWMETRGEGE